MNRSGTRKIRRKGTKWFSVCHRLWFIGFRNEKLCVGEGGLTAIDSSSFTCLRLRVYLILTFIYFCHPSIGSISNPNPVTEPLRESLQTLLNIISNHIDMFDIHVRLLILKIHRKRACLYTCLNVFGTTSLSGSLGVIRGRFKPGNWCQDLKIT